MKKEDNYTILVDSLKLKMIKEEPDVYHLKRYVEKELTLFKTFEEIDAFLTAVILLMTDPDIDSDYTEMVIEFFDYVKQKLDDERGNINWRELYNALIDKYISDVKLTDFIQIMKFKRYPLLKDRIIWIGNRYEGYAFGRRFGFKKLPEFNKCFVPDDGKDFRGNDNTPIKKDFEELLDKFCMK